jgi:glycosyltransferase involved in cell wall biosynthesis
VPKKRDKPTVAFITTCKGRLHHLKQTLPQMLAEAPDEMIVVDYDCPDGAGAWVEAEYPQAKVVRAAHKPRFNLCDARNHGAAVAESDWLFFVDADIRLTQGMLAKLRKLLAPGGFYMPEWSRGMPIDIWGSCVAPRETYTELGGYDEVLEGWGADDEDFYHRMQYRGLERRHYPSDWVSPIEHDDAERVVVSATNDRFENEAVNACYAMAKRELSRVRGGNGYLPLEERRKLMTDARRLVLPWYAEGARTRLSVRFAIGRALPHGLASQIRVLGETAVTVVLEPPHLRPARKPR